jgi:hypothetical protein
MSIPIKPQHLPKPDQRRSMNGYGQTRLGNTAGRPKRQNGVTSNRRHLHSSPTVSKSTPLIQASDPWQATAAKPTESIHSP